jgi:N-6 DNA Methylase
MNVHQTLARFGADSSSVHLFEYNAPELLPYATLLTARAEGNQDLAAVDGVYEWQGAPLLYLAIADLLQGEPNRLSRVRRLLAMRGDAPYLGVVSPGRLEIYRIALDNRQPWQARVSLGPSEEFATLAFLGNNRPAVGTRLPWISQVVLNLLSGAIDGLKNQCGISGDDAISLVGRALFTRFLADRKILQGLHTNASDPSEYFDNASHAATTSAWLDDTFNGDFLPLTESIFEKLPRNGYRILGDVLRRAPGGQLSLGWQERWDHLDFAHIPVGVLSQAYENYLRLHAPEAQRREGGYYTPQPIAELMVKGAFRALERDGKAHEARVLDPAAGAGIFLSTAFRNLVAARWRHDGKRPETRTLREILYNQITGFDINEAALRFAALGLYLLSIELDPRPEPLQKLKFKNLRNIVLRKFEGTEEDKGRPLGSLGPEVEQRHVGRYDLVVGNPPWASGTKLPNWSKAKEIVGAIARTRLNTEVAPPIPNEVLDLPFVWRAMEWAKPGSQIAFALHGRFLFQQGDGMYDARKALFQALDATSVVNGAELRQTKVWPEISAPFCILFARNQLPSEGSGFRLITPRLEQSLNKSGSMRIDSTSAEIVTPRQISDNPPILKILSRGSQADLEVYDHILSKQFPTLQKYWSAIFEDQAVSGNGYQKLRMSSRTRKTGDGQKGALADHLSGLLEITPESMQSVLIPRRSLVEFQLKRIHDPRPRELFRGPLLILQKSPPAGLGRIRVAVSKRDAIFNETYYGYSAYKHSDGFALVQYLAMVLGSKPALWFALMTSGEFGFEREVIEKATIDRIVIPAFEQLTSSERRRMDDLFASLLAENTDHAWNAIDAWTARLYGLKPRDLDIIRDTLQYSLPFAENRKSAQSMPTAEAVRLFCSTLNSELATWASRFGKRLTAQLASVPSGSPWRTLRLSGSEAECSQTDEPPWFDFFKMADHLAASEIVFEDQQGKCIWIGQLDQARYWTQTRARLVAREMIWEHPDFLTGEHE